MQIIFESNSVFQWESPNATSQASPVGQDLINHQERDIRIHLLVRKENPPVIIVLIKDIVLN